MDQTGDASVQWHPGAEDQFAGPRLRRIEPLIANIRHGRLRIRLPNGRVLASSDGDTGLQALLVLDRWRALRRIAFGGDIGFAEAYIDGDWTSPDPVALIRLASEHATPHRGRTRLGDRPARDPVASRHARQHPSGQPAQHHGALRSRQRFLRPLARPGDAIFLGDLDRRHRRSRGRPRRRSSASSSTGWRFSGGERVLEIGCGWGALATRLAETKAAEVTALTLSPAQLEYARARTAAGERGRACRFPPPGLSRRAGPVRPDRLDRDDRGGRRSAVAALLPQARRLACGRRAHRDSGDHHRRGARRRLPPQSGLHPDAYLPRRLPADEVGAQSGDQARRPSPCAHRNLRGFVRAHARGVAAPVSRALARGESFWVSTPGSGVCGTTIWPIAKRVSRKAPSTSASWRWSGLDRVEERRAPTRKDAHLKMEEKSMITRRSAMTMLAALAALPAAAKAAEFQPYDPAAVEKAIASGKPVVVHVYASWCLQCHIQAILPRRPEETIRTTRPSPSSGSTTTVRRTSWRSSTVRDRP